MKKAPESLEVVGIQTEGMMIEFSVLALTLTFSSTAANLGLTVRTKVMGSEMLPLQVNQFFKSTSFKGGVLPIILARLSLNKMSTVVGWFSFSWPRAPDQIQLYPDQDTIAQLLPARRLCLFDFAI